MPRQDGNKCAVQQDIGIPAPESLRFGQMLIRVAGKLSHMGAWFVELPERRLIQTDEAREILGVPPGVAQTVEERLNCYAPEFRETIAAAFEACVREGAAYDLESHIVTATGRCAWVRSIGEAVRDANGGICGVQGALQDISERRQAMEETRRLGERLSTTLESITDAFFTLDREWRFTFVNGQAERLLQRPRAELIGQDWRKEFAAAVDSEFGREYRRALQDNTTVEFEAYYPLLKTWFSVRAYPTGDGLAIYSLDITARKRESAALVETAQTLSLAANSARIGIWDWDVVANRLVWDSRMYALYGIPGREFSGALAGWQGSLHPEDRERAESEIMAAVAGSKDYNTEFRVVWPNGEVHQIEAHAVVIRADNGSAARMIGVNWDITERKRAEEAIAQTLQRLNEAQRIGLMGDWEYTLATGITWSPQVFRIFGRDPQLGPPRDLNDATALYDAASGALMKEKIAAAIRLGEAQQYELLVLRPDGERVHVLVTASPGNDESGRVVKVRGTVQDISARKRAESELRDRARQQELIATLGRSALADSNLDHMFAEAAAAVSGGLGVRYSKVMELAGNGSFVLKAGKGWDAGWLGRRIARPDDNSRLAALLATRKAFIVDDFASERPDSTSEILRAHGIVSGVEIPIVCGDGLWGVLSGYSNKPCGFAPASLDFLQGIANILATGIDRKRRDAQMEHLAQYDPLTDLPNRSLLDDRLAIAVAQAQRAGTRIAVLYLDLDQFKNVNDSFGHSAGDHLLKEAAHRLTSSVRKSDTVSRQGGDEFVILLREIDSDEATALVAEKLIRAMSSPVRIGNVELLVSISIGIASFPDNGNSGEALLRKADAALYAAKEAGRKCYRFYSEDMNARAHGQLTLVADLSRAIERNQMFLEFQPQVSMGSGAITGVEALVRWRHPTLGIVPPARFIPVAEDSGLIDSIGNWVLDAACLQQAKWVREGTVRGRIAVNVSALQFRRQDFLISVAQTLERTGLDPRYLELELTESAVMQGIDIVREKLTRLNELGVKLAIDDFGTGQSSLSYLKQFPIHRLKIDQSFVAGLPGDKDDAAITQAVISMGHSLGLNVIAEGIETLAQADYLKSMKCDDAQGFFYSRPLLPTDLVAFLRSEERR
jgi:diguanylate cyclase (GGDEF)-like protein/PAS domain S-box-containing protein